MSHVADVTNTNMELKRDGLETSLGMVQLTSVVNYIVVCSGAGTFFGQGGAKNSKIVSTSAGKAPQTPLFSNVRYQKQDTQLTCLNRHQLHTRSSDRNFFGIIFCHGKQDCLLPLRFSNYARITTKHFVSAIVHVCVKCKYFNVKTEK